MYAVLTEKNRFWESQWLAYWIVFSLFTFVEFFLDIILCW